MIKSRCRLRAAAKSYLIDSRRQQNLTYSSDNSEKKYTTLEIGGTTKLDAETYPLMLEGQNLLTDVVCFFA